MANDLKKRAETVVRRSKYHIAKHKQAADPMGAVYEPGLKRYPEFASLVDEVFTATIRLIQAKADRIKSEMPYKQQFVLEEVITKLKESV